jgi:hypothetical protein
MVTQHRFRASPRQAPAGFAWQRRDGFRQCEAFESSAEGSGQAWAGLSSPWPFRCSRAAALLGSFLIMPSHEAARRSHDALSAGLPAFSAIRWHSRAFRRYSSKRSIAIQLGSVPNEKCANLKQVPGLWRQVWGKEKAPPKAGLKEGAGRDWGVGGVRPARSVGTTCSREYRSMRAKGKGTFSLSGSLGDIAR